MWGMAAYLVTLVLETHICHIIKGLILLCNTRGIYSVPQDSNEVFIATFVFWLFIPIYYIFCFDLKIDWKFIWNYLYICESFKTTKLAEKMCFWTYSMDEIRRGWIWAWFQPHDLVYSVYSLNLISAWRDLSIKLLICWQAQCWIHFFVVTPTFCQCFL